MYKIKCIIIEDEPLAVKVLSDYILQVPFLELKATFKNALLALEYLDENTVNLIFLDIHLPKLKGMTFLKTLSHPPAVVVTTAYHQYALEGYDLNVADYLLKPISFDRFLAAVNKVKATQTKIHTKNSIPEEKDFIFLPIQKRKVKISFSEIVYIESQREYIKLVTTEKSYTLKISTKEIESLLPAILFRRIHRSFIVSIDKIGSYTAETVEVNGISLPIGRAYRDSLDSL